MNFTPKISVGPVVGGLLTIAVVGLIGSVSRVAPAPVPIAASQDAFAWQERFQTNDPVPIVPGLEVAQAPGFETARSEYYQPIAKWYKSKRWWKRNAPIVGGAAGGGIVGGLVGGPAGAAIGGAAGGGAGYLYKRHKHRHHRHRR